MKYINNKQKLERLDFKTNDFYTIIDFDRTLTSKASPGSWAVLENEAIFSKDFVNESLSLVDIYYPYEINYTLNKKRKEKYMEEWYWKNMNLFYKYHLTYDVLMKCLENSSIDFRDGAKEFLDKLNKNKIPTIILSAGIGNVIEEFLKLNNAYFNNIHVISNFLKFEDGKVLPFKNKMIHSLNKSTTVLPENLSNLISEKKQALLLGDLIEDIQMIPKEKLDSTLTIGFLDDTVENNINNNLNFYNKNFDLVFTDNTSFKEVKEIIGLI